MLPLLVAAAFAMRARLRLSRAKHPSLRGHVRMARRIARLIPYYEFDASGFSVPMARRPKSPNGAAPISSGWPAYSTSATRNRPGA